jgi:hypothetical protein
MQTMVVFTNKSGVLLMRLSRFVMLCVGTVALSACGEDDVTAPALPPLAEVRFINAVSDTGGVDIHAMDQVELSPNANNLTFRQATVYFPTEAGVRHFRVFPTSTDIDVTSQTMSDAFVTLPAGTRVTLLLAGSARAGTVGLWVVNDESEAPPADQIGIRLLNAAGGIVDGYVVASPTTPLPASPDFTGIGQQTWSSHIFRNKGAAAVRVADAGTTSIAASAAGPSAPATLSGQLPSAGVTAAGTVFSAYYFAAGAAGSANAAVTAPSVIWFVDRNPCDEPPAAACTQ